MKKRSRKSWIIVGLLVTGCVAPTGAIDTDDKSDDDISTRWPGLLGFSVDDDYRIEIRSSSFTADYVPATPRAWCRLKEGGEMRVVDVPVGSESFQFDVWVEYTRAAGWSFSDVISEPECEVGTIARIPTGVFRQNINLQLRDADGPARVVGDLEVGEGVRLAYPENTWGPITMMAFEIESDGREGTRCHLAPRRLGLIKGFSSSYGAPISRAQIQLFPADEPDDSIRQRHDIEEPHCAANADVWVRVQHLVSVDDTLEP